MSAEDIEGLQGTFRVSLPCEVVAFVQNEGEEPYVNVIPSIGIHEFPELVGPDEITFEPSIEIPYLKSPTSNSFFPESSDKESTDENE